MADEAGVAAAFYEYAADSSVIGRGGKIIKGREAIRDYYEKNLRPGTRLQWAPDFADVSGDIGYTWGNYTHFVPDSIGKITESHGVFHTVWKRQRRIVAVCVGLIRVISGVNRGRLSLPARVILPEFQG